MGCAGAAAGGSPRSRRPSVVPAVVVERAPRPGAHQYLEVLVGAVVALVLASQSPSRAAPRRCRADHVLATRPPENDPGWRSSGRPGWRHEPGRCAIRKPSRSLCAPRRPPPADVRRLELCPTSTLSSRRPRDARVKPRRTQGPPLADAGGSPRRAAVPIMPMNSTAMVSSAQDDGAREVGAVLGRRVRRRRIEGRRRPPGDQREQRADATAPSRYGLAWSA